jgi:hypothetical protein
MKFNISTATSDVKAETEANFDMGYVGTVSDTGRHCPPGFPSPRTSSKMLITFEFIQNFAEYAITQLPTVQLNSNTPSTTFQFRLIDLEYILNGIFDTHGQYYQSSITFNCTADSLNKSFITNTSITA